jgi:hypothetical protein
MNNPMDPTFARIGKLVVAFGFIMFLMCAGAFLHALSIAAGAHPPIDELAKKLVGGAP